MPDLKNRRKHEASLAGAAMLLFFKHRPLIAGDNFDQDDFVEAAHEALAKRLEKIHDESFRQLAEKYDVDYDPTKLSRRFAARFSKKLGTSIAKGLAADMRKARDDPEADVHRSEILHDLSRESLNRARAKSIAVTETTRAISMAEAEAVKQIGRLTGIILKPRWMTSLLSNVCEICEPYHAKPAIVWRRRFPFGPPAHPGCNCFMEYDEA